MKDVNNDEIVKGDEILFILDFYGGISLKEALVESVNDSEVVVTYSSKYLTAVDKITGERSEGVQIDKATITNSKHMVLNERT